MRLGWRTPRVDSLKLANYTIIENAHEVRKYIFVFYYVALFVQLLRGEKIRACVSRYDQFA